MEYEKGCAGNIDEILEIVASAKAFMKSNGVVQWTGDYPSRELLLRDIAAGNLRLMRDGGRIAIFGVLLFGVEPTYVHIDGVWHSAAPYATLHRVAAAEWARGKGAAGALFAAAADECRARGTGWLRIDTHEDNHAMRTAAARFGFSYCGIITITENSLRMAFDLAL